MFKILGRIPSAFRQQRLSQSPNYKNGVFKNVHPTSMNKPGGSTFKTAIEFLMAKKPADVMPLRPIPSLQTDLYRTSDQTPTLIWFGHSSYLIKYKGKNILVDPVFSGHASPISTAVKAFPGSDRYQVEDMPDIDFLILTHDHYDHIDYETIMKLKAKTKSVICTLGVGEHLELWGFTPVQFTELDWWQQKMLTSEIKITATPARHFSGRALTRNKTLWASFVLELGSYKIFIGGDSGYDDQFKKIGEKFGSIDLALLECGQYNLNWPFIYMFPEQTAQAAKDLKARVLMPVHWGKFILSTHSWTEPIERLLAHADRLDQKVTTPLIGEVFRLDETLPVKKWWR